MPSNEIQRLAVSRKVAAQMIETCARTIANLNRRGELPFVRCGRRVLIRVVSLEKFLRAKERKNKLQLTRPKRRARARRATGPPR